MWLQIWVCLWYTHFYKLEYGETGACMMMIFLNIAE